MSVGWKVYDLGKAAIANPEQPRYFIAGVDRKFPHWTTAHCHTLEVAQQIAVWRNDWENLKALSAASSLREQP